MNKALIKKVTDVLADRGLTMAELLEVQNALITAHPPLDICVALGSAFDGIQLYGPFEDFERARTWAERHNQPYEVKRLRHFVE
jgi:hypothetical protein